MSQDPTTDFKRSQEIRDKAQTAFMRQADSDVAHRAALARSRVQTIEPLKEGDVVYVWRNNTSKQVRGWVGPGLVVCVNSRASSVWVSMRGILVKCNADRVRIATDEEWMGAEIIKVLSQDARNQL